MKQKMDFKKITKMRLFMPIVCLLVVLLVNVITTPSFFKISLNNGVLYGYIIDVINRASELVILAVGMTLVTAASGGQDISVGATMAVLSDLIRWGSINQYISESSDYCHTGSIGCSNDLRFL